MKFGQLVLRKIIEIVATRCQIVSLKCTKINFGWGTAPDPAGGAYRKKGGGRERKKGKGRGYSPYR